MAGFKSWLRGWRFHNHISQANRSRQRGRKTPRCAKPILEGLETRLAPAAVSWTGNATTYYGTTTQIVVGSGGLLNASGTAFNSALANAGIAQLIVSSGGHLQAGNSSFALSQLNLNIGAVLNSGDLVGNGFDLPLYIPAIDMQYLSGSANSNLRFRDINLQPDTLTS